MRRMQKLLLVGLVTVPAAAFTFGGWAVTTVENVPEYAVAGTPLDLTWTVRQHGFGLLSGLTGRVTGSKQDNGQHTGANAQVVGEGMYRATVTIPSAGEWDVKVAAGFGPTGVQFPLKVVAAGAPAPTIPPGDRGYQLFVAKGCVTCHSHQLTKNFNSMKVGPDLSEPKFTSVYLTRFLTNPAIKTDWKTDQRMPNLGLKPAEITALVAFLGQK